MASKDNQLKITGKGSVFFTHFVKERGKLVCMNGRLYPVFYIPGLSVRLLSIGSLLNDGELELRGTSNSLEFKSSKTNRIVLACKPHMPGQTIYWLEAQLIPLQTLLAKSTVLSVDYDIMHRCFAHLSKDVLRHTSANTQNFPSIKFPSHNPVCPGCAEGKMTHSLFLPSQSRATRAFGKIHMDLKSFPVQSYGGFNYLIVYLDDYTSYRWTQCLKLKSDTEASIRQFVALVKTKYC